MSQKTIKDASILIHKLLTTKVEKAIITNLVADLVEIYQRNESSIGTVDHITGKDVLNLNETEFSQGDFKSLIEYVIDKRHDKIRRLLIHLLNQSPYKNDEILFKIISTMEDALFIQTEPSCRKIRSTNQDENSITINLKFKMEPEHKFRNYDFMDRYFVAITHFQNDEELEKRITNVKLYQGLCCIYGFRRKTTPQELRDLFLPDPLSSGDEVENVTRFLDTLARSTGQEILVTVSSYYKISLENWFTRTYEKRRIPSEEQVRLQVQVFQVLFGELQLFLTNGVTQVNLLPNNFFFLKFNRKSFLPRSFGLPDDQVKVSCSDFDRIFISENSSSVRYSIGIVMLYALAACDKDEFVDLVKLFKSEDTELNLKTLYHFSPILSTSKSIRNLIRDIIHSNDSLLPNEELCKMVIGWNGLFRDFEHNIDDRARGGRWDFHDDGPHRKLLVSEVLASVIDETYTDLAIQEIPEHELAEVLEKMRNDKYADFDENLLTRKTFQEVLNFVKSERPWMLPTLLYNSRTYFTAELISKLYKSIEKHWDGQFTNLSYLGANNFGHLFQRRQTIPNTLLGSRIVLLIPKMPEEEEEDILGKIRTRTYGKLNFSVNLNDFSYFYDHLHLKSMYSDQLREIITPYELDLLPAQVKKILNARVCVEVATIQFQVARHTLRDYINYIKCKSCVGDTGVELCEHENYENLSVIEIAKNIINDVRKMQMDGLLMHELVPDSIHFMKAHDKEGKEYFKLPLTYWDRTFISVNEGTNNSTPSATMISNIHSLGMTLIELLASSALESYDVDHWESIIARLSKHQLYQGHLDLLNAIGNMLTSNEELRMTSEKLKQLDIPSISLNEEEKMFSVEQKDLHILGLLADDEIGVEVIKIMFNELVELETVVPNGKLNCDKVIDLLLEFLDRLGRTEDYEEIQSSRENFKTFRDILNGYLDGVLFYSELIFKHILYECNLYNNESFREKLFTIIQKTWLAKFHVIEAIGNGAFGFVFKANNKDDNSPAYAMKIVIPSNEKEELYAEEEVKNMDSMKHPNIMGISEFVEENLFTEFEIRNLFGFPKTIEISDSMTESDISSTEESFVAAKKLIIRSKTRPVKGWIITMDLAGSTLSNWLKESMAERKEPNVETGQKQLQIVRDLIRGMKYLQAKGIMHSDLKPDNILFSLNEGKASKYSLPVQIADLGLSRVFPNNSDVQQSGEIIPSKRGNTRYQAPEVKSGSEQYTLNSELYSIGLIILEVLNPVAPSNLTKMLQKLHKNVTNIASNHQSTEDAEVEMLIHTLLKMTKTNPLERMSCDEFQRLDVDWIKLHYFKPCGVQRRIEQILLLPDEKN